jgi:hydrogenase expression/formation protein HypD
LKYLSEFRSPELVDALLRQIRQTVTGQWNIMEVCGGQTHSLVKNGILNMLPSNIQMIHGPGCPVCVTPVSLIDKAVHLSLERGAILCSFGDMITCAGSGMSLLEAKARGADVRILYSPLEAVKVARENPGREVVFFAVGLKPLHQPTPFLFFMQAGKKLRTIPFLHHMYWFLLPLKR